MHFRPRRLPQIVKLPSSDHTVFGVLQDLVVKLDQLLLTKCHPELDTQIVQYLVLLLERSPFGGSCELQELGTAELQLSRGHDPLLKLSTLPFTGSPADAPLLSDVDQVGVGYETSLDRFAHFRLDLGLGLRQRRVPTARHGLERLQGQRRFFTIDHALD